MSIVIDLPRDVEEVLNDRAVQNATTPERLAAWMLNDMLSEKPNDYLTELIEKVRLTPERIVARQQQTIERYELDNPQSAAEHWSETIGKWPGEETDEQIAAALADLS